MEAITIIILCILGGWFARMNGGAPPRTDRWIERALCMSFFLYAGWTITHDWTALFALVGVLGLSTGHGQYFLSTNARPISPENTDFFPYLFFGRDPRTSSFYTEWYDEQDLKRVPSWIIDRIILKSKEYGLRKLWWRCVVGMWFTGFIVGLPVALLAIYKGELAIAFIMALTGFAKSFGYIIGYWLDLKYNVTSSLSNVRILKHLSTHTNIGEFLNGVFRTFIAIMGRSA